VKILVVTTEPISATRLRAAVGESAAQGAEVLVVAPALHASALRFWMSDADGAIERAQGVQDETVTSLNEDGITAVGDTGEGDVIEAIGDALTTFPADRILLFTHSEDSQRHGEGVSADELRARFPVPVEQAVVAES
jgi:hypothetical protein